jgi:hypothetical protein
MKELLNLISSGLPGRHMYVTQQGYDAALVEAQIFNHTRQLREAGYNVRGTSIDVHQKIRLLTSTQLFGEAQRYLAPK